MYTHTHTHEIMRIFGLTAGHLWASPEIGQHTSRTHQEAAHSGAAETQRELSAPETQREEGRRESQCTRMIGCFSWSQRRERKILQQATFCPPLFNCYRHLPSFTLVSEFTPVPEEADLTISWAMWRPGPPSEQVTLGPTLNPAMRTLPVKHWQFSLLPLASIFLSSTVTRKALIQASRN